MPDEYRISELTGVTSLNNGDLVEVSQVDALSPSGYTSKKATFTDVGAKVNNSIEYATDLQTTDKTVIGAINEVNSALYLPDTASGTIATFTTSLEKPLVSCEVDQNATKVTRCGFNLLKNIEADTTHRGVTFTVNSNGTVSATRVSASTNDSQFLIYLNISLHGNFLFYGAVLGSGSTYDCYMWDVTTGERPKKWDGSTQSSTQFETPQEVQLIEGHSYRMTLRVRPGYDAQNLVFYPMLLTPDNTTANYEDYQSYNGTDYPVADIDTITTLQGVNNIFADVGTVDVTYLETIKEYIDKRVTP